MASLLKFQRKDGSWGQLIDRDESWSESSSSAMFTFAMITGVKNGWLDGPTYGPAARKGWIAAVGYVDQNSDVTQVCEGTGKQNSLPYYLARKRRTGDFPHDSRCLTSLYWLGCQNRKNRNACLK
jgi:unsaturated rhamnogalacturonyl hydrolase